MKARIVVAVVIVSMLTPVLVWAQHLDPRDSNDTRGPLDVRRIDVSRRRTPRFEVFTLRRWTARRIWDHGFGLLWLDTFGTSRFDYYALVRSTGRRLVGRVFRDRKRRPDRRLFAVRTSKASRKSFTIRIPLRKLRMPSSRAMYRWEVQTLFIGSRCRRTCFDFVPDRRAVREPNPFAPTTTTTSVPTTTIPTTTIPTTTTATTVPVTTTTP